MLSALQNLHGTKSKPYTYTHTYYIRCYWHNVIPSRLKRCPASSEHPKLYLAQFTQTLTPLRFFSKKVIVHVLVFVSMQWTSRSRATPLPREITNEQARDSLKTEILPLQSCRAFGLNVHTSQRHPRRPLAGPNRSWYPSEVFCRIARAWRVWLRNGKSTTLEPRV